MRHVLYAVKRLIIGCLFVLSVNLKRLVNNAIMKIAKNKITLCEKLGGAVEFSSDSEYLYIKTEHTTERLPRIKADEFTKALRALIYKLDWWEYKKNDAPVRPDNEPSLALS